MRAPISTAFAIAVGLVVLAGYFISIPLLQGMRLIFLEWAAALAGTALLVGVTNLVAVHWWKVSGRRTLGSNRFYSFVLLLAFLITFTISLTYGPGHPAALWLFQNIQVPVEASLMAVLAISLVAASTRLLRKGINLLSMVFVGTTVIVLLATGNLFGLTIPGLGELRDWIVQVPATGGGRGLLLGVALGTAATGLRILMGADRPYAG